MAWKLYRSESDETIVLGGRPVYQPAICSWMVDGGSVAMDATGTEWTPIAPTTNVIDVPTFLMRFYPQERVAIRGSEDPLIVDFLGLVDDPRVQNVNLAHPSVQGAVMYMALNVDPPLIAVARPAEILAPEPVQ